MSKLIPNTAAAILLSTFFIPFIPSAMAQQKSLADAIKMENEGRFREATSLLKNELVDNSISFSQAEKERILFEIERMRRIRVDYSLTADELYAQLEHSVRNISRKEFDGWVKEGRFDSRIIDGRPRFVGPSKSNLFFRNTGLESRRISPTGFFGPLQIEHNFHASLLNDCITIEDASDSVRSPYVLPMDFKLEMTVVADSGEAKPGELVKAWIPIPREYPFQMDFRLVSSSSKPVDIAPPNSPIRSVFMEQPADSEGGAKFSIEYTYRTFGVYFKLEPGKVVPYDKSDTVYKRYTSEAPNIIFTGKIKKLSEEIVGNEMNPLLKAKTIYDWISLNIKYSFAREYSTIRNISDYCLTHRYGDCGQEAMLFITLCRYNGIPAQWQSGWLTFPNAKDIHDWTEIYILPYGWIPVDPYMGIASTRYMMDLTAAQRKVVHAFYFGGLDQYRMSANSNNNQILTPAKAYFRSDNVDFQRGELETDESNIYFNKFRYSLNVRENDNQGGSK